MELYRQWSFYKVRQLLSAIDSCLELPDNSVIKDGLFLESFQRIEGPRRVVLVLYLLLVILIHVLYKLRNCALNACLSFLVSCIEHFHVLSEKPYLSDCLWLVVSILFIDVFDLAHEPIVSILHLDLQSLHLVPPIIKHLSNCVPDFNDLSKLLDIFLVCDLGRVE